MTRTKTVYNKMGNPMTYNREGDKLTIGTNCVTCSKHYDLHFTSQEWYNWTVKGMAVQEAFPNLPAGDRELLLSGICDACWEKTFGGMK